MSLEEIEGIRADIKKLKEERELNIREVLVSLSDFKKRYDVLVKENGEKYCAENCSDIIININKLTQEFKGYHI